MTQLELRAPPSVAGSVTSAAAADAIRPGAATLRAQVLNELRQSGPMTDEELQTVLAMNPSTQRPRRIELVNAGFVRDSGKTRNTKSGRAAVVWECV